MITVRNVVAVWSVKPILIRAHMEICNTALKTGVSDILVMWDLIISVKSQVINKIVDW